MEPLRTQNINDNLNLVGQQFVLNLFKEAREEEARKATVGIITYEKKKLNNLESIAVLALEIFLNFYPHLKLKDILNIRSCSKELKSFANKIMVPFFNEGAKLGRDHHYFARLIEVFKNNSATIFNLDLSEIKKYTSQDLTKALAIFNKLRILTLPTKIKPKNLPFLTLLSELKVLHCEGTTKITDLNAFPFSQITNLNSLYFQGYLEKGWENLSYLTNLESLAIPCLPRDLPNLNFFTSLQSLKNLGFGYYFDPESVSHFSAIATLTNLTYLAMSVTQNEHLKGYIEKLPNLQKINVHELIRVCPTFYENMTSLTELDLSYQSVTKEVVQSLTNLHQLKKFKVFNCQLGLDLDYLNSLNNLLSLEEIEIKDATALCQDPTPLFHPLTHLRKLSVSLKSLNNQTLQNLDSLIHLESLTLNIKKNFTDPFFSVLSSITTLTHLNLKNCGKLTEAGFFKLRSLTALKVLNLSNTKITANISILINRLPLLETLKLAYTDANLSNLLTIPHLTLLKTLDVEKIFFTKPSFHLLEKFTRLEKLKISGLRGAENQNLTDQEMFFVSGLTKLTQLKLNYNTSLSNLTMQHLTSLTNLKALFLNALSITNEGAKYIVLLTKLEKLAVSYTKVKGKKCVKFFKQLKHLTYLDRMLTKIKASELKPLYELHDDEIMIL